MPLTPGDDVAAELARAYTRVIDSDGEKQLVMVGRQFLETLIQLGMTPKARASFVKEDAPLASSGLDELRSRRVRSA